MFNRIFFLIIFFVLGNIVVDAQEENLKESSVKYPVIAAPDFVPCDTVSFSNPLTIVENGIYCYAFENYPQNDFSRATFKKMLKTSSWFFLDDVWFFVYLKPILNYKYYDIVLSDFQNNNWFNDRIMLYEEYDFKIFKLPSNNLYFLALVNYNSFVNSRGCVDYDGTVEEVKRVRKREKIPPYKFKDPLNTYVRVLYPLENRFRIKEDRDKTLDEYERMFRIKIERLY